MKKIAVVLALAGLCILPLSACVKSSGEEGGMATTRVTEKDLAHHRFVLVGTGGKSMETHRQPSIEFNEGMNVSGSICNRFQGQGELSEGRLYVRQMASTRMLCVDPELNQLEHDFFAMLRDGVDIRRENNTLTFSRDGRSVIFTLKDYVN